MNCLGIDMSAGRLTSILSSRSKSENLSPDTAECLPELEASGVLQKALVEVTSHVSLGLKIWYLVYRRSSREWKQGGNIDPFITANHCTAPVLC